MHAFYILSRLFCLTCQLVDYLFFSNAAILLRVSFALPRQSFHHSATTKFAQFTKSLQNAVATLSRLIVKFREVRKFHFLSSICKCTIFLQVNCLVSKSQYFIDVASIYLSIFGFLKVDAFMLEFNTENMLAQLQDAPWIQKGSLVA